MDNKMFFFDIDGTLIDVNKDIYEITDASKVAMDELKSNGHDVFLSTGRCKCFIVDGVSSYPFSGYVTCNGGHVSYKGKTLYKTVIEPKAIIETMNLCSQYDMNYYFESNDYIYIKDRHDPTHVHFANKWGMKDEICVDHFDPYHIESYIGMIYCNNLDDIPVMIEKLSPYFDIQRHRSRHSFDLTLRGTSKAKGIMELVKAMHRDMKDTIAFGDGRNDLEMIEEVSLGIAMGNAVPELKKVANYVTANIEDEGIKFALQHFGMINQR